MDNNETAVALMALLISPAILWFITRAGRPRQAPSADAAQLQSLYETAQRLERRMESLEMVLDSELPGWRSRSRTP